MKLMAVLALACGFTAAPMVAAGAASALPGTCDGAECVPFVDRNVDPAAPCAFGSRFPFGLDATGGTFLCTAENKWVTAAPLIGMRTLRAACDASQEGKAAQTADGQPMICDGLAWNVRLDPLYYAEAS
jgi:hypothetical protein